MGADLAYTLWLRAGNSAHFIGYYALVLGLQGRPWSDLHAAEKRELRSRFDAIKAANSGAGVGFERVLDEIGLRQPRSDT
jgi:DNA transformation protein